MLSPSFLTYFMSYTFLTLWSLIASLNSAKLLNSIPYLNLYFFFICSFLNFSYLTPLSSSDASGSELCNSSLSYSPSSNLLSLLHPIELRRIFRLFSLLFSSIGSAPNPSSRPTVLSSSLSLNFTPTS
ncbi:hypothetical protein QL285_003144 [Trifolium repens]|nr:hypothetical protein QL285_003144 [Trifolium repens]